MKCNALLPVVQHSRFSSVLLAWFYMHSRHADARGKADWRLVSLQIS